MQIFLFKFLLLSLKPTNQLHAPSSVVVLQTPVVRRPAESGSSSEPISQDGPAPYQRQRSGNSGKSGQSRHSMEIFEDCEPDNAVNLQYRKDFDHKQNQNRQQNREFRRSNNRNRSPEKRFSNSHEYYSDNFRYNEQNNHRNSRNFDSPGGRGDPQEKRLYSNRSDEQFDDFNGEQFNSKTSPTRKYKDPKEEEYSENVSSNAFNHFPCHFTGSCEGEFSLVLCLPLSLVAFK